MNCRRASVLLSICSLLIAACAEEYRNADVGSADAHDRSSSVAAKSADDQSRREFGWRTLSPQSSGSGTNKGITVSAVPLGIESDSISFNSDGTITRRPRPARDLDKIRRTFWMESSSFLPGEPILIRFAIELAGEGEWAIEDWYYHNNRDETLIILLRDKNGNWVDDRYHPEDFHIGGGSITVETFSQKSPEIHWLPVQQYCAIRNTGEFDLFCIKCNFRCWVRGFPTSPLLKEIPTDVIERARTAPIAKIDYATDYAHFSIRISAGSDAEQATMIEKWSQTFSTLDKIPSQHRSKPSAIRRCWEHSLRNDFLPPYVQWRRRYVPWMRDTDGATREQPFALIQLSAKNDRWEAEGLTRAEAADRIPKLIDQLTATEAVTRSTAEFHLRQWTGVAFGHEWSGHISDRPTLPEGREMQKQWQNWWTANKARFAKETAHSNHDR